MVKTFQNRKKDDQKRVGLRLISPRQGAVPIDRGMARGERRVTVLRLGIKKGEIG